MSENQFTVGLAADGKIKLHFQGPKVAVGFQMEPDEAKRLGSTLQSEAYHATH